MADNPTVQFETEQSNYYESQTQRNVEVELMNQHQQNYKPGQKKQSQVIILRDNKNGSQDLIELDEKLHNSCPSKLLYEKKHLKSKNLSHNSNNMGKSQRKSQIYPDLLLLQDQNNQNNQKSKKMRIICRVQQFALNLLHSIYITKERFNFINRKKDYFNQIGDKSSDFQILQQSSRPQDKIQNLYRKQRNQADFERGSPIFQSKKTMFEKKTYQNTNEKNKMTQFVNLLKKIPLIPQQSNFRRLWDFVHIIILQYYFILIPIIIAFNKDLFNMVGQIVLNIVLIILLFIDILCNFNTSVIKQGQEIKQRKVIMIHYLENGFLTDLVSLICLIIFISVRVDTSSSYYYTIILLAFFLRFRWFRIVLKRIEMQFYFSLKASQIMRLLKLLYMNLYIIHIFSCFWILIGKNENDGIITWIQKYGIQEEEWYVQFLNAFYFSAVTMVTVGYGDVTPSSSAEKIYSIITILTGCGVFAYSISEIGSIFKKINEENEQKKDNLIIVNGYMRKKKIPINLQTQIRHYLQYYWNESLSEQVQKEQSLVDQLSNTLKENLKIEANRSLIQESAFFKAMFSENTLNKLAQASIEQRCHPEEVIYNQGDSDDCSIYFIEKGSVQCYYFPFEQNDHTKQIINLNSNQFFGEIEFITGQPRNQHVRSLKFSTLIKISRDTFIQIVKENEQDYQKFCMIRDDILLNQNYSSVHTKCSYCCYSKESLAWDFQHFEKDCPLFHFNPDKKKLMYKFIQDPLILDRQAFNRKQQTKLKLFRHLRNIQLQQQRFQCDEIDGIDDYIHINKLLNETVFTDEDLSDSVLSSDSQDSQPEQIYEEDFSDSDSAEQEKLPQQIDNQNSLNPMKQINNQKSILSNKNKIYSSQITIKNAQSEQIQLVPSISEMAFDIDQGIDNEEIPSEANRLDSFFNNKNYKNTTIQVNLDTNNRKIAGQHTENQNNHNQSKQPIKQEEKGFSGESVLLNQESHIISKPSLKNSMSVKFKLPSPNQNQVDMRKGKSLQQADQIQTKKQSSLKKYLKKGQSRNEQDKMKSNKVEKQDYLNQNKMQNKYLQKFISIMRSISHEKLEQSKNANDNYKKLQNHNSYQDTQILNKLKSGIPFESESDIVNQTFSKDNTQMNLLSNDDFKKEIFAQKINTYISQLKQMQAQISQYNQFNQTNNSKLTLGLEDLYLLKTQFEKMKHFDVYFPHNNFTKVIEHYSEVQYCLRKKIHRLKLKKKSQTPKEREPRLSIMHNIRKIYSHNI
ncbi:cyclic nucleotide-binding domain protein (macronuclear) [Tetrahymena thermophila SB210]|uniref:Cyclic nucleotide-binding domain protein n=1 Tax=Tetrahymena thermophila (strain SB210) TaxID=312017 RepID=I7M1T6_TETTS|nr:cyclic nucleotide-binding domain protein [Tetrahymena thermophila SB210]EAR97551.2 cyclic nucleotide-binding domain protein [Tetrahymena thermophila SB210]|eukprot:XP_001017796.2 cyclic nucleotide-binding domain protein [Tetrahymena thermophila SB210]